MGCEAVGDRVKVWNSVVENKSSYITEEHTELCQKTWPGF